MNCWCMYFTSTTQITSRQSSLVYLVVIVMMTSLRLTLQFQHYVDVVRPKPSRQNRGNRSLKEKEIGDIMEVMKKLDESGPTR